MQQEVSTRRWSSLQSRDFGSLHATLATLILNCDVSHAYTEGNVFPHLLDGGTVKIVQIMLVI